MLIARVRVTATEEGRPTLIERLTAEAVTVPESFDGCERYAVTVDAADPATVVLVEEWASRADFEAYTSSPHFASVMGAVAPCLAGPPDSAYYEGELVGP